MERYYMEGHRKLARDKLYREAERGLQPISWGSLGLGHGTVLCAGPIEMLALEQYNASLEFDLALVRGVGFTPEMRELLDAHQSALACRLEQARHYGMLVCRAFFQIHVVSKGMPNMVCRIHSQEIVELVERFLNG